MTSPLTNRRTPAAKQEAALLAAFRRMGQRERFKLLRATRRPKPLGK
jgi:hypothetical protein